MSYIQEHLRELKIIKETMVDNVCRHYHVGGSVATKMIGLSQVNRFFDTVKNKVLWAFALRVSSAIGTLSDRIKDEEMTPQQLSEELAKLKDKILKNDSGSNSIPF